MLKGLISFFFFKLEKNASKAAFKHYINAGTFMRGCDLLPVAEASQEKESLQNTNAGAIAK